MNHFVLNTDSENYTVLYYNKTLQKLTNFSDYEAFCFRNQEFDYECQLHIYIEILPLSYEVVQVKRGYVKDQINNVQITGFLGFTKYLKEIKTKIADKLAASSVVRRKPEKPYSLPLPALV